MVDRSLIVMGPQYVVRWMRFRQEYPAQEYLHSLGADSAKVEGRLITLLEWMANTGYLPDPAQGHWLSRPYDGIFEFKPLRHRFFSFITGRTIYLTNGAPKRKRNAQEADYALADRMRRDFLAR